jgi:hypothetical protein
MRQLEKAHGALEKEVNRWKLNILEKVEALERQSTVALRIEDAFRSAQQTMNWVASKLENLSVGLALLMDTEFTGVISSHSATSRVKINKDVSASRIGSYTVVTKGGSVEDLSGSTSGICSHAIGCSIVHTSPFN